MSPVTSSADHRGGSLESPVAQGILAEAPVKPTITVMTPSYPPAFLAGGPARSVHALVEALANEFSFFVVTSATDTSATGPMLSVRPGRWNTFGRALVWYESRHHMSARTVARLLRDSKPRVIYLNSLLDYRFGILPLLVARTLFRGVPVVLAPRGELSPGALALKRQKKQVFITTFRLLNLHNAITWHASTDREKADIERVFGLSVKVHVAIDLRAGLSGEGFEPNHRQRESDDHGASLVFLSRIVRKKNVATLIEAMHFVRGSARLFIAGPIEDPRYWGECQELINGLPDPQTVTYVGPIPADDVVSFLNRFDLFILPTLGENFGHVVLESLAAGTPVIVGDDTPWHQIEPSGAGWLCDPANAQALADQIEHFLSLGVPAQERMRAAAREVAQEVLNDPSGVDANRSMFQTAFSTKSS
jgi:glycosyltransferase involved in cell wall biosynthesis